MGLMINPAPTFTLNDGSVASEGKLYFYENGSTTIEKDVFLKPNLDPAFKLNNPLTLTDAGRLPTCFGTGTYTIVLESAAGVQQFVRNDVAIDDLTGQFADYSTVKTYNVNEIVRYTDGNYYYSLQNNNKGNVPSVNSEWWAQIAFLEFFNTSKAADADYMLNNIVIYNGFIYRSLENNNGDTPPSAKWANLTFNDSVAGNFTVGGDLRADGNLVRIGDGVGTTTYLNNESEISSNGTDFYPLINSNYFSASALNTITATPVGNLTSAVLQYWVVNKLAFGLITCECAGAVAGIDFGTLPIGHRPAVDIVYPIAASDNERTLTIEIDGDLIINNVSYTLKRSTSITWVIA